MMIAIILLTTLSTYCNKFEQKKKKNSRLQTRREIFKRREWEIRIRMPRMNEKWKKTTKNAYTHTDELILVVYFWFNQLTGMKQNGKTEETSESSNAQQDE